MIRTFGPAATETDGKPVEISCVTGQTYCFLLHGRMCSDQKPPRAVDDPKVTPEWCKYRAGALRDVADLVEFRAMGLANLDRAELIQIMKVLPKVFRGFAYNSTKPRRLGDMHADRLRHCIRDALKAGGHNHVGEVPA